MNGCVNDDNLIGDTGQLGRLRSLFGLKLCCILPRAIPVMLKILLRFQNLRLNALVENCCFEDHILHKVDFDQSNRLPRHSEEDQ